MSKTGKKIISDDDLITKPKKNDENPPVYLKTSKRLLAAFLSIIIIFVLGLLLDKFVVSPIFKNVSKYNEIKEIYKGYDQEYKNLQDHYNLYTYNENKIRIPNEKVTKEETEAFLNDNRVKELVNLMRQSENNLLVRDVSIIAIDYFSSTLIYALIGNFLFGVGRSFPAFILHYELVDDENKKLKAPAVFKYSFAKWFFNGILGLITLGILPLYNAYYLSHDENYQCPIDKLCHIKYRLLIKYNSDK